MHKAKYFLDPMMAPLVCGETDCSIGCHDLFGGDMPVSIPFFVHYNQSCNIDLFCVQCLAALSFYAELSMG